jgi:site-specific recombinase XerD
MPKPQSITLSQAIEGYTIAANARGLADNTIREYTFYYLRLTQFFAARSAEHADGPDPQFESITVAHIQEFLNSLTTLSQKTKCNIHIALSSMWKWGVDFGLVPRNLIRDIKMNKPEQRAIHPYTKEDVKFMIANVDRSKSYTRPGKVECNHALGQALRNKALIYFLLDTGLRAGEVASAQVKDFELKNLRVKVFGKGSKERIVPFSYQTGQVLWRYLTTRGALRPDDYLFISSHDRGLSRGDINHIIGRLGKRAGVSGAHPHRFRHTFAINFLRNGGNVYTLKEILGHASLKMCLRYLELAQADIEHNYRPASPVKNWGL